MPRGKRADVSGPYWLRVTRPTGQQLVYAAISFGRAMELLTSFGGKSGDWQTPWAFTAAEVWLAGEHGSTCVGVVINPDNPPKPEPPGGRCGGIPAAGWVDFSGWGFP